MKERRKYYETKYDSFIGKDKTLRIDKWKSEISELKESIREINNENASSTYKIDTAEVLLYNIIRRT